MNPDPDRGKGRATTIGFGAGSEVESLMDLAPHFHLTHAEALDEA